ncbi:MAG TPA: M20/M25/M40 family metallo-hydrolase [Oligoflexia bacterium]|nr:M20/M25/M40 family metallo-hydrolase [Oligoflexia bacterium]HMP47399.1 M20/M25/M40 family metallo-hydrolase [Oligoflexia bacterium]
MEINSYYGNPDGVRVVQDMLSSRLKELGFNVSQIDNGGSFGPHLLAESDNFRSNEPFVLVIGHADSAHSPALGFSETVIDGDQLKGPGGYDMKAGLVMLLLALDVIKNSGCLFSLPVRILIIGDEEIGMPDSRELHFSAAQGAIGALVLESGRPDNSIILQRKGISRIAVRFHGKSAHSGNDFWSGANVLTACGYVAHEASRISSREKNLTLNIGSIHGGDNCAIVPDYAEMKIDIRFCVEEHYLEAKDDLNRILETMPDSRIRFEIIEEIMLPPMVRSEKGLALANDLQAIFNEELNEPCKILTEPVGGASSGNLISGFGIPVIDALGPFGAGAHTVEEWVSIKSIRTKALALAHFFTRKQSLILPSL